LEEEEEKKEVYNAEASFTLNTTQKVPTNAITPSNLISTAWASPSASFSDDFRSTNNPKFNRK